LLPRHNDFQQVKAASMKPRRLARFVSGRLLLRYAVESSYSRAYKVIESEESPPLVKIGDHIVNVSISYSNEILLVGLSEAKFGAGIEYIKSNWSHDKAALFCCEQELAFAKGLQSEQQLNEFHTRLLVSKEAYCKSLGISVLSARVLQQCLLDDPCLKELGLPAGCENEGAGNTNFEQGFVSAVYSQAILVSKVLVREVALPELAIGAVKFDTKP